MPAAWSTLPDTGLNLTDTSTSLAEKSSRIKSGYRAFVLSSLSCATACLPDGAPRPSTTSHFTGPPPPVKLAANPLGVLPGGSLSKLNSRLAPWACASDIVDTTPTAINQTERRLLKFLMAGLL